MPVCVPMVPTFPPFAELTDQTTLVSVAPF